MSDAPEAITRGTVAIGIEHGAIPVNMGTLIRSAALFGADCAFTVGRRYETQPSAVGFDRHFPVYHYDRVGELPGAHPEAVLVGVEFDPSATSLEAFHHPEKAVYLLGAEDSGLSTTAQAVCDRFVTIPAGPHSLNVSVAGSIVLYDRTAKRARETTPTENIRWLTGSLADEGGYDG